MLFYVFFVGMLWFLPNMLRFTSSLFMPVYVRYSVYVTQSPLHACAVRCISFRNGKWWFALFSRLCVCLCLQALAELQSQMPNVSEERARQAEAADPRFRSNASVLRLEQLDSSLIM
jgi:hypothetical protein